MKALGDLGFGLGLVGATIQTLQTGLDAFDTNIEGQLQTLNGIVNINRAGLLAATTAAGLLFLRVNGNSTAIHTIETRVNYHRKALGDLGLGLGLVGVTVETLQKST